MEIGHGGFVLTALLYYSIFKTYIQTFTKLHGNNSKAYFAVLTTKVFVLGSVKANRVAASHSKIRRMVALLSAIIRPRSRRLRLCVKSNGNEKQLTLQLPSFL